MSEQRNKGRAPGMTLLGVPMPVELKDKIKKAADLDRRKMADWSRLELEHAADMVIASHASKARAEQETKPVLKVAENEAPYRVGNGKMGM